MQGLALAYKFAAVTMMLGEINYFASQLHLPINQPIREQDVNVHFIVDPRKMPFSGRLDTKDYSFSVGEGYLRFITNLKENRGELSMREYNERLSKTNSLIDTNQAYLIAKGWLKAMEVDIEALERDHPPRSMQRFFFSDGTTKTYLPVFDVEWGDRPRPTVRVSLNGSTTNLLYLRQEDTAYSRRHALGIKEFEKLLAIPDDEFLNYTAEERSNFLAQFTVDLHTSHPGNPTRDRNDAHFDEN